MRKLLLLFVACLTLASCQEITDKAKWAIMQLAAIKNIETEDTIPEGFKADIMLPITPIKDQGRSDFCWVYAMLATIETEHLNQGDSVNLSVDYVARMYVEQQAMERFRTNGEQGITMRGMGPMTIDLIEKYGVLPYDSYYPKEPVNYKVLIRKIKKIVDADLAQHFSESRCLKDVRHILDEEIGYLPKFVFMLGMQYTYLEFAHSVCLPKEYESLTSDDSQPMGSSFVLPYKDNLYKCKAVNVSADSLVNRMEKSLSERHPVMWEGGPNDNHAVAVIGEGKDREGTEYFVAKNSWGEDNPTHGLLYIPKDYVHDHTAVIVVKKEEPAFPM